MALCKDPGKQTRKEQKSDASYKDLTVTMICINTVYSEIYQ